jgi:hypothetical protein
LCVRPRKIRINEFAYRCIVPARSRLHEFMVSLKIRLVLGRCGNAHQQQATQNRTQQKTGRYHLCGEAFHRFPALPGIRKAAST